MLISYFPTPPFCSAFIAPLILPIHKRERRSFHLSSAMANLMYVVAFSSVVEDTLQNLQTANASPVISFHISHKAGIFFFSFTSFWTRSLPEMDGSKLSTLKTGKFYQPCVHQASIHLSFQVILIKSNPVCLCVCDLLFLAEHDKIFWIPLISVLRLLTDVHLESTHLPCFSWKY